MDSLKGEESKRGRVVSMSMRMDIAFYKNSEEILFNVLS